VQFRISAVVGLWAPVFIAACSSSTSAGVASDAGTSGDDAAITCQNDTRADTFTANMKKAGKDGLFNFVLVAGDPAPPGKGTNTWTLRVLDASSVAVPSATIAIKPFMPDHGHGSSIVAQSTVQPDGSYQITPLYFFMPGLWQVTFTAQTAAGKDSAVFTFCVPG
jgi:hypothetical protein